MKKGKGSLFMKDKIKGILIGVILGLFMTVTSALAVTETVNKELFYNNIKIELNEEEIMPADANGNYVEPFVIDGTTYLPVRAVANALNLNVAWDGDTNTVKLSTQNNKDNVNDNNIYKIGDTAEISASYGDYKLTIESVVESTKRNEYTKEQPSRIIIVNYEYENINCSQDITISQLYFHAYDKDGDLLDVYPSIETKSPNTISAGGKKKASVAYGLNSDVNYIKLQFYNIDYSDMYNPTCTFELQW